MRKTRYVCLMVVVVLAFSIATLVGACDFETPPSIAPEKEGEPISPLVGGTISGLNPEDLVMGHVFAADGSEIADFTRMGDGLWEGVITHTGEYTITAEAEGYTVEPSSYKILVEDEIVYIAKFLEISDKTLRLNFHFSAE